MRDDLMKNRLSTIFVITGLFLLSLSQVILADVATATKSSAGSSVSQQEITNEAEYAEFVRKRESLSHTSSSTAASPKPSTYPAASASSSQTPRH